MVNTSSHDQQARISPDGSTLYFCSERPGGYGGDDIWKAPIIPVVDFNGDGKVDGREVFSLADHWGTDDSLCDIGPFAWGDGIVDIEDLKVLAEHIGEEVDDPTLVAHWALDETEGFIAHDGVGEKDGTVVGAPAWRPDGGQVNGAFAFDGTALIAADHVLSPSDGPFSVLAWVQGGAAGQAIISQHGGVNWLMADAATGALMTELKGDGRFDTTLGSDSVITDGDWHRVAFTWDGTNRRLYADGMLVAEDTQEALEGSSGGMVLGCGANMAPGTFWTGLIDDVRIYSRAVRP